MAADESSKLVQSKPLIQKIVRPFQEFARFEASSGILLLCCAIVALAWANSPCAETYFALWDTELTVGVPALTISKPLLLWINDALMAVFFFLVGLEIKRELIAGELASPKKAALPIAAAAGGMILPAAIYASLNAGSEGAFGWGIPMATDIAFAVGVLALLGERVPAGLKVFLVALAIVDDIGAVLVIALFYTQEISWMSLAVAGVFFIAMIVVSATGSRNPLIYMLLGIGLWFGFLKSGVHATIAGVLAALVIPVRARIDADTFLGDAGRVLDEFRAARDESVFILSNETQQSAISSLEAICEKVQTPLQRLEHGLLPWVNFFIMPLFALANAGVAFGGSSLAAALADRVAFGIVLGLVIGKTVGIFLFARIAVAAGLAELPGEVRWRDIFGVAMIAGIGFTMALFIASLAFGGSDLLDTAKLGIIAGSLISGVGGYVILRTRSRAAQSSD